MPTRKEEKEAFDRICGWTARVFLLLLSASALLLSFLSGFSCDFFSFENPNDRPWIELVPPFDGARAADLGLFSYRITDSILPNDESEDCIKYDDFFASDDNGMGNLWVAAQICAVAAVCAGGLATLYVLVEIMSPCWSCSWIIPAVLLFAAFGLQCCTFLIFLETNFCFRNESSHECRLERGGWFSIGSVVGYWLAWLIMCNLPRTGDGCLLKKRRAVDEDRSKRDGGNDNNNNNNEREVEAPSVKVTDQPKDEEKTKKKEEEEKKEKPKQTSETKEETKEEEEEEEQDDTQKVTVVLHEKEIKEALEKDDASRDTAAAAAESTKVPKRQSIDP